MARPNNTSRYYSGQGICLMGVRDGATGKPMGMVPIGNVPELTISIEQTTEEHKESWSGQRAVDVVLATETTVTVAITFESFDPDMLALGLLGTVTNNAAATETDLEVKVYLDKWTYLDHVSVSNLSFKDAVDAALTLTEGVDVEINAEGGAIMIKTGNDDGIVDGDTIKVTYDYDTQYDLQALTTAAPERYFILDGLNTQDSNKPVRLEIFRLQTQPFTGLGFINDGIAQASVSATALADATRSGAGISSFFREIIAD
ncbi:hypothetical protein ACRXCV_00425 (plasmid) [Halobacteriovorax sp. GFR7]|uniref:phage tail tube protein n=1 Tax=unclassified Halobacteriovorax TaxID=2639665 RepID=UPI003D984A04